MRGALHSLRALPLTGIGRHPDVALAIVVGSIVAMMIFPVPSMLLDVMLAANMAVSALILIAVLLSERPLSISTFPTLLLITTLFRLSLNVSTTRLILGKGDAGDVVAAFGHFVIGGDLIVGVVVFLVITLVQFLVIAKGAERVAEVGARFTLDAMPGKQMSIDAAVRAGSITEEEGQTRRDELGRESHFYGAMDGAMKFVKGDAIAGLIITAVNLVAGLIIGVTRFGMPAADAARAYCVLSVGDALVAQIPALLITLAAAVLTTRVGGPRRGANDLGTNLKTELLAAPKALLLASAFAAGLGLIPGLPMIPFFVIAAALFAASRMHASQRACAGASRGADQPTEFAKKLEQKVERAKAQRALVDNMAPAVPPIGLDLDPVLSRALGFDGTNDGDNELLTTFIPQLRDALHADTGVRFPGVRVRANVRELAPESCVIRIKDVPACRETVRVERCLAVETRARLEALGVHAEAARHPLNGTEVSLVATSDRAVVEASGVTVWAPAGIIALHLARVLRRRACEFIGLQETAELVERLEKVYPALVKEVVPKIVSLSQLADILKRLVDEGVAIRDLKSILECLAEFGSHENDGVRLTESVRAALGHQLAHAYAGLDSRLPVVLLDPVIEETVRGAITHTATGSYLALDPDIRRNVLASVAHTLGPVVAAGVRPVVLTTAEIRRYVRKLMADDLPEVPVVSFQELPNQLAIQPLGRIALRGELPNPA